MSTLFAGRQVLAFNDAVMEAHFKAQRDWDAVEDIVFGGIDLCSILVRTVARHRAASTWNAVQIDPWIQVCCQALSAMSSGRQLIESFKSQGSGCAIESDEKYSEAALEIRELLASLRDEASGFSKAATLPDYQALVETLPQTAPPQFWFDEDTNRLCGKR
jgi:hypothetical protein